MVAGYTMVVSISGVCPGDHVADQELQLLPRPASQESVVPHITSLEKSKIQNSKYAFS